MNASQVALRSDAGRGQPPLGEKPRDGLLPSVDQPGGGEDYREVKKDDKDTEVGETGSTTERK